VRRVGQLASTATAAGLFAFICGLVINNLSLSRAGSSGLDLGQARYVLVGAAFIVISALPLMLTVGLGYGLTSWLAEGKPLGVPAALRWVFAGILFLGFQVVGWHQIILLITVSPVAFITWMRWALLTIGFGFAAGLVYRANTLLELGRLGSRNEITEGGR